MFKPLKEIREIPGEIKRAANAMVAMVLLTLISLLLSTMVILGGRHAH